MKVEYLKGKLKANMVLFLFSLDLLSLLSGLLKPYPQDRITLEMVIRDPWVFQPVNVINYAWEKVFTCGKTGMRKDSESSIPNLP